MSKHFDYLCTYIIYVDNIKLKFDMIILTEAWLRLQDIIPDRFHISGYNNHFSYSPKNQNDLIFIFINNRYH